MNNYAKAIRVARTAVGLSKRQLCLRCKLSPSYATHIEAGKKVPSIAVLEALSKEFGIKTSELVAMAEAFS